MPKRLILCIGSFIAVLAVGLLAPQSILAQSTNRSLTIIPPKFELFSNPGDTLVERIRVRNDSDLPATYTIAVEDFTTSGEEGQVVLEEGETDTSFALASWIEPESADISLQPKEEKAITFVINVPRSAEPGGHYASILFRTGGESTVPGAAVVSQRVGSLVLLRVSGNTVEKATLENFSAPSYLAKGPVTFAMRVKNEGNVHVRPEGTIVITNMFGKKVAELPLDSRNVLPGAVRKMETVWDQENLLGRYKATLVSSYGQGAQKKSLTSAVTFTVASTVAIITIVVSIVAAIGIITTLIVGRGRLFKAVKVVATGN